MLFLEVFRKHKNTVLFLKSVVSFRFKISLAIIKKRNEHFTSPDLFVSGGLFETCSLVIEGNILVIEFDLGSNTKEFFQWEINLRFYLDGNKILLIDDFIMHDDTVFCFVNLVSSKIEMLIKKHHLIALLFDLRDKLVELRIVLMISLNKLGLMFFYENEQLMGLVDFVLLVKFENCLNVELMTVGTGGLWFVLMCFNICILFNLIQDCSIFIMFIVTLQRVGRFIYVIDIDGLALTLLSLWNCFFLTFTNIIFRFSKKMLKFTKRALIFSFFLFVTLFIIITKLIFVKLTYFNLVNMSNNLCSNLKGMGINFIQLGMELTVPLQKVHKKFLNFPTDLFNFTNGIYRLKTASIYR